MPKAVAVEYELGDHAADGETVPASGSVALDGEIKLGDAPKAEDGYIFSGWKDSNGDFHSAGENFTFSDWSMAVNETIVFTAQYVQKGDSIIEFNTNGGTAVEPVTGSIGDPVVIQTNIADGSGITKDGYTFRAWYSDETLQTELKAFPDVFTSSAATYFVGWDVNSYKITYKLNEGKSSDGSSADFTETYDYGEAVTAPDDPTRDHYSFNSWEPTVPQAMPAHDLTIEAIWDPASYTVTFKTDEDDNGTVVEDRFGSCHRNRD
jgi:hypothetical protein